jgi:CTP synthase (UTP-ammonia lyase)
MLRVAIIGDFDGRPSHLATNIALDHSAAALGVELQRAWIPTDVLAASAEKLVGAHAILCSPGSPYQSMAGALNGIRFAREGKIPFLGTCGGFQHAVIEFARAVLHLPSADHGEVNPESESPIIVPLSCSLAGMETEVQLQTGTKAFEIYRVPRITEKFRCNYGLSLKSLKLFDSSGFRVSGTDQDGQVIIMEHLDHPYVMATLFQPQLSSTADTPHPIFNAFVLAAKAQKSEKMS